MARGALGLVALGLLALGARAEAAQEGSIRRLTHDPQGRVQGFLLSDGTEVRFADRLRAAAQGLRPGDAIAFEALRLSPQGSLVATDLRLKERLPGPASALRQGPAPDLRGMSKRGLISRYLYDAEGRIDGLLLDDDTEVAFPVGLGPQVLSLAFLGEPLEVFGEGYAADHGVFVNARGFRNREGRMVGLVPPPSVDGVRDDLAPP